MSNSPFGIQIYTDRRTEITWAKFQGTSYEQYQNYRLQLQNGERAACGFLRVRGMSNRYPDLITQSGWTDPDPRDHLSGTIWNDMVWNLSLEIGHSFGGSENPSDSMITSYASHVEKKLLVGFLLKYTDWEPEFRFHCPNTSQQWRKRDVYDICRSDKVPLDLKSRASQLNLHINVSSDSGEICDDCQEFMDRFQDYFGIKIHNHTH